MNERLEKGKKELEEQLTQMKMEIEKRQVMINKLSENTQLKSEKAP